MFQMFSAFKKVIILILTFCIFQNTLPSIIYASMVDLDSGLVLDYEFENSLNDSSANRINGTLAPKGTASYIDGKSLDSRSVMVTGAVNAETLSNFQIGNKLGAISEKLDGSSVITLSFWVKKIADISAETDIAKIFCGGSSSGISITYGAGSNENKLRVRSRPTNVPINDLFQSSAWIDGASLDNWLFCVAKIDYKAKVIQIIPNGDVDNMITTNVIWNYANKYCDGNSGNNKEQTVADYISTTCSVFDDFRIYNRALTYDEIKTLYNSSHMSDNLVLHYDFDNNLFDKSSSEINGILIENSDISYVDGKFGKAVSANFSIGNTGQLSKRLMGSQIVTISFWAKKKSNQATDQNVIDIYGANMPSISVSLFANSNNIMFSGTNGIFGNTGQTDAYNIAPVGVWMHYVVEFDYKNKQISVTINGNVNNKLVTDISGKWEYDSFNTAYIYRPDQINADNIYIDELYIYSGSIDNDKILELSNGNVNARIGVAKNINGGYIANAVYNDIDMPEPTLAIACYNSKGQLLAMKNISSSERAGIYKTLTTDMSGFDNVSYVKVFLFSGIDKIIPFAESDIIYND